MLYVVVATIEKRTETGISTVQIPTFFLNASTQGIISPDHACRIAEDIINPTKDPNIKIHAHSYLCDPKEV